MASKTLLDTPFQFLYKVFVAEDDANLCGRMADVGLIYTGVVGIYSLFAPAPYGRYQTSTFGPTINAKIGWVTQECMAFFVPIMVILATPNVQLKNYSNVIPLALFGIHYFHRSFIYPLATSSSSRPAPILAVLNAALFTSYNGFLQSMHLANVAEIDDSIYGLIGTSIFLAGMAINITHDRILISLREQRLASSEGSDGSSSSQRYQIPRGGLFEYVSGANYLGEIIEWIGFAVITRRFPQVVFSLFTTVFLGIRAIHHHRFYLATFGNSYPQSRTAILPFIV